MKNRFYFFLLGGVAIAALVLVACSAATPTPLPAPATEAATAETAATELVGDSLRGGLLYDNWIGALGAETPAEDQPLWATQTTNTRTGASTWRCRECHGFDYLGVDGDYGAGSHLTGFKGVADAAKMAPTEVLAWLDGTKNPDHDFSGVMDKQALTDIALFLTQEQRDMTIYINADKTSVGNADGGKQLYQDTCSDCHGPQGNGFNFGSDASPNYINGVATSNPWMFIHRVRFGQPGEPDMPSAIDNGWTDEELANVLAYAQTLPNSAPVSEGARIYDTWWAALRIDEPTGDMPLWAAQGNSDVSGAETWACSECHGWDYKGVSKAASMSAEEITAWMDGTKNSNHNFSSAFEKAGYDSLIAFLKEGTGDVSAYVTEAGPVNGDPTAGKETFSTYCARCHGDDGTEINFAGEGEVEYVGTVAVNEPLVFFHKARFGQPDEKMVGLFQWDIDLQAIADLLAFAQTLPTK